MVFTDKIIIVMHHSSQGMYKKNILSKSLNIEVFKSSCSILLIFFLLVVGSRVVGYFEQAAEGYIDPSIIMNGVFLRFPDFITLLIPLSFFLGVMITVSRLYAEREIYGLNFRDGYKKNEKLDKNLLRYATIKVRKFDLETTYFKNETKDIEKKK